MSSNRFESRLERGLRTLNTIRHLRPRQALYFVLRRRVGQRGVKPWHDHIQLNDLTAPDFLRISHSKTSDWSYSFSFLNQTLQFPREVMDWNPTEVSRLWRYHLHYFDYLRDEERSLEEKSALIDDWIDNNPQGSEPAWEPYTTSLRIVNWCLFFLSAPHGHLKDRWLGSLYDQARWLERNLEWHILANHYFENIKAMLFAGFFFAEINSRQWLTRFQRELVTQLTEQTLGDGGHYERSPHYHCIFLQNCIELYALHQANPYLLTAEALAMLKRAIRSSLTFLQTLCTPDDNVPLFNDSVAQSPGAIALLQQRASELGIISDKLRSALIDCPDSGYYGYRNAGDYFLIDCGDIGPTYQPGHTHCDFLSYVLMTDHHWLIVDSGVYEYAAGAMRQYVRSTAAHNTVSVDDCEQSEIWGEFRVGRRAQREHAGIKKSLDRIEFEGAFKGFPMVSDDIRHRRQATLELTASGQIAAMRVDDNIDGNGSHRLASYIHLHPDIGAAIEGNSISLHRGDRLIATITFDAATATLESGWYCPEFGKKIANQTIRLQCSARLPHRFGYRLRLHK